ncbi:MAG: HTH domain-containing protein, partial [Erysipelothrix sp.]|nr:HTH domain-containing protein [Erysipelothrix sp.]
MRERRYANIDSRLLKILDELCSESDFVTLQELSKRLNLTRRQVEYDVKRLDDIFD